MGHWGDVMGKKKTPEQVQQDISYNLKRLADAAERKQKGTENN
jgi:hypothetical protein